MTQPTGELPQVPLTASPDNTVVVPGSNPQDGILPEAPSSMGAAASRAPSGLPSIGDRLSGPAGAAGAVGDATGVMPSVPSSLPSMASERPVTEHALTDPFPDPSSGVGQAAPAPQTKTFDSQSLAAAAAAGSPVDARSVGIPARAAREQASRGAPTDLGRPAQRRGPSAAGQRPVRGLEQNRSDRTQDTEFKLAGNRRKQKPKEPNKLLLGLGLGLIVVVGAAAAYFFTRGDGGESTETAEVQAEADVTTTVAPDPLAESSAAEQPVTEPEPVVDEPTLFFDEAQTAPLQQGETYSIDLVGEPEGSLLQVIVDDIAQGSPDAVLPDLILPAGRHSLFIQISNGAEVTQSTPVNVYVLGPEPVKGYRVNLSSVDMQTEGWAEAIRQFDEFRAAGHEGLQLAPLTPGYWNIFVAGLGEDVSSIATYCEKFSLEMPTDCFGSYYEPTGVASADDSMTETTDTDGEAMTDSSDASTTTVAGG